MDEKDIWEKYIKPQYTILKRIKRKIFGSPTRKSVRTLDDIDFLDYDFFIKLLCVMMICVLVRMVVLGLIDIYRWFFPPVEEIISDPFFKQILYRIEGLIYS